MTHDPFCPTVADPHDDYCDCMCWCDLIAKVREDERANMQADIDQASYLSGRKWGYKDALRDAVEAVKLSCSADIELVERTDVIAVIEALKEKP